MIGSIEREWEKRSREYGTRIEGVLPKSLPKLVNEYLDRWMYEQIKNVVPSSQAVKILDLGCGYGRLSQKLLRDFSKCQTFGIDVSQNYVEVYNKNLSPRGKAIKGDIRKPPFPNNYFDIVFMVTTLMYITKKQGQERAMKELFRVLKPGGSFVIIERNPTGHSIITLGSLVSKIRGKKFKEIKSVSFEKNYMESLIKESGGILNETNGLPFWTLFLPILIVFSKINQTLLKIILKILKFTDQKASSLLTPSLYIAYIGEKNEVT